MSKENFDAIKAIIEAIPESETKSPHKAVDKILQEAEDLYEWNLSDKEEFIKVGYDWSLTEDLPVRIGACRYAESVWLEESKTKDEALIAWKEKYPEAKALRDKLLRDFRFAYHNSPELMINVRKISEGDSQADMVQDLSDLSVLGKANPELLTKVGFDLTLLDKAAALAEESARLMAKSHSVGSGRNEHCIMRDKAYTHLKKVMDEIRRVGQYVFYENESRRKGYLNKHDKKKKKSNATNENNNPETGEE